ncbi:CU044_2847 family protein [Streptomyces sp. NPDC050997]|uniref:CU044_2847 family protein n=1 Tax=Streptomyces sp. NPDC050997 TaxID=3155519 RepID=UPI00343322B1
MAEQRARLAEVELDNGQVMLVEVVSSGGGDVAASGRLHLSQVKETLGEVSRWALESVREALPQPPDRLEVEFGLKLAVKSGRLLGVLAEAGGEGSITVKMGWDRVAEQHPDTT